MIESKWALAKILNATANATVSNAVQFDRPYESLIMQCANLTQNTTLQVQTANPVANSFGLVQAMTANGVSSAAWVTANTTNLGVYICPVGGFDRFKVIFSKNQATGRTVYVRGTRP